MKLKSKGMVWVSIMVWPVILVSSARGTGTTMCMERTLAVIQRHLDASSPPWSDAWRCEYLDTIREVLNRSEESYDRAQRLGFLERGFPLYWDRIKKDDDRALFELQCAQITWYVESLMAPDFPGEEARQVLPHQWETLWREATDALLVQFPLLDPNVVHQAEADHLDRCRGGIEAPLLPIFQRPFTAGQVGQIRNGWREMRYARVDLMRQLGGEEIFLVDPPAEGARSAHPHYLLAQRSLDQLKGYLWTVIDRPSEDYLQAWRDYREAQQCHRRRVARARMREERLRNERSWQLPQTEYLSFLFAVVLESAHQFQSPSAHGVSSLRIEDAPPKEVVPMR